MIDITKIKREGNITSKMYDDLLTFIFNIKKEISGPVMKDTFSEIIKLYKTKNLIYIGVGI